MSLYPKYEWGDRPMTASGLFMYYAPRTNPMEEAYRIALRSLEDSYAREMQNMFQYAPFDDYYYRDRKEYEIRGHFERDKNRLYDDFRNASQRYMYQMANQGYGYGPRRYQGWDWGYGQDYSYKFTYLNSKETTPVPTETKSYIITDSNSDRATYYAGGDGLSDFKTLAEAEKEAQDLARENPDNEFTIYQTVKKYKVAGTPLDTVVFV